MSEITEEMARKLDRASQLLSGLSRAASKDCNWLQRHPDLHAEILELQKDLRESAATATGNYDVGNYLRETQVIGSQLSDLFQAQRKPEQAQPVLTV